MTTKIAIIGSGALGTALGKILYDTNKDLEIIIYGVDKDELKDLSKGANTKYFPKDIKLPKFNTTNNLKEALTKTSYVVLAVPSKVMKGVFKDVLRFLDSKVIIINGSKGFYGDEKVSLHEGLARESKNNKFVENVVSLIGPSHAEEMVLSMPTVVAAVSKKEKDCLKVQRLFSNSYFRVYAQTDIIGAEAGATYKNILAISTGIAAGLGYGINTIAAILTRGLTEMKRYNKAVGGKNKTIYGLTGIGDLIVTATSDLSRNFTFGKEFARYGREALDTTKTVEGLTALKMVYKISLEKKLNLPIVEMLYKAIYEDIPLDTFIKKLWDRNLKHE